METRISIVKRNREDDRKMFECLGVRFADRIAPRCFGNRLCVVEYHHEGKLLDQGRVALHTVQFSPFSKDKAEAEVYEFTGFTSLKFGRGAEDFFNSFGACQMEIGDELVFVDTDSEEFLRYRIEYYLGDNCGAKWNSMEQNAFLDHLREEFPYPIDWRQKLSDVRAIYSSKMARTRTALVSGEIASLDSDTIYHCASLAKQEREFEINILVEVDQNMFVLIGVCFAHLPMISAIGATVNEEDDLQGMQIEIVRDGVKYAELGVANFMRPHFDEDAFVARDEASKQFLVDPERTVYLCAKDFVAGDKLILRSPLDFDLLEELVRATPHDLLPELSQLSGALPTRAEAEIVGLEDLKFLSEDITTDIYRQIQHEKLRLLRAGELKIIHPKY